MTVPTRRSGPVFRWWALSLGLGVLVLAVTATACGDGGAPTVETDQTVHGLLVDVVAASLLDLDSITLLDGEGNRLTFDAGGRRFDGFSPGHVREHMVQGVPVTVTYREADGRLLVVAISD